MKGSKQLKQQVFIYQFYVYSRMSCSSSIAVRLLKCRVDNGFTLVSFSWPAAKGDFLHLGWYDPLCPLKSANERNGLESSDWIELARISEISVAWTLRVGLYHLQLLGYNA